MPPCHRHTCSFLLLVSLAASLQAQPVVQGGEIPVAFDAAQARFEHFTVADGLPENSVLALLQDHLGFIWMGTQNGLVRYDGQDMTVFHHDADDPHSFGGLIVQTLFEDRAGDLWIGTEVSGLVHYDRATGHFTTYRHDPRDTSSLSSNHVMLIYEDVEADLWMITGDINLGIFNLDRFNRATGTFTRFRHDPDDPESLSHDRIPANRFPGTTWAPFFEDQAGTLWVGTFGGGLNRFDPQTDSFTRYRHDPGDPQTLSNDIITHIGENRAGQLLVSTWGGGLNWFDRETETFTHLGHDPDSLSRPGGNPLSVVSDSILATYEDRLGALWITTLRGLDRLDPDGAGNRPYETIRHYAPDPDRDGAPSSTLLKVLHEDEEGLWFASGAGGAGLL